MSNQVNTQPIYCLFQLLKSKKRIKIWLYDNNSTRIEGDLTGFDEYMNLVLKNAKEVKVKGKGERDIGTIMLKGDNIALIQEQVGEDSMKTEETKDEEEDVPWN